MENESFERAIEPQPVKRKRSSILKLPDKRISRDSRTVSFNDRCIYKELHQDGTCDVTNFFLRDEMDLTMMDVIVPETDYHNQTMNSSMDMSMDQASINNERINGYANESNNSTLSEEKMIEDKEKYFNSSLREMDLTLISQFLSNTSTDIPTVNFDCNTMYESKKMSLGSDVSMISSLHSSAVVSDSEIIVADQSQTKPLNDSMRSDNFSDRTLVPENNRSSTMVNNCSMTRISDISSFNATLPNQSIDQTYYGAFHDSNNISIDSRTSSGDSIIHDIQAVEHMVSKVDHDQEERIRKLDDEIATIFEWYPHIVNKSNKYEFAISIFGLRGVIWLIFKVNPETYPYEKLNLRFAVSKKWRHLYPFPEYALALKTCTQEGRFGYLIKLIINAQKFRKFLKAIGYRREAKNKLSKK